MARRVLLSGLVAAMTLGSTGCCGRVRAFFYRLTHCPGCYPAYGYADGGYAGPAPVVAGPAPVYGGPVHDGGYGAPAPGCTSCGSGGGVPVTGYPAGGVPVDHGVPAVPVGGYAGPVFNGPPIQGGTPTPMPMGSGPGVYTNPQAADPNKK